MWRHLELSVGDELCELGTIPADDADLVRAGVFDTRTGKRTWLLRATLSEAQCTAVHAFRRRVGRDALVRLRGGLPPSYAPYEKMQLDGCRLTLDGQELRLEDPDTTDQNTWLWKP